MLNDLLGKADLHIARAGKTSAEIRSWGDLSVEIFTDSEKVKTIDSFMYRFIKLQDLVGQKLCKTYLDEVGEFQDRHFLMCWIGWNDSR